MIFSLRRRARRLLAAAGLLMTAASPASSKLSDVKNFQLVCEPAALTPAESVTEEALDLFRKEMPRSKISPEFADVRFHVRLAEIPSRDRQTVSYYHNAHVCGVGTDKYASFEKVYWSRDESGTTSLEKYDRIWRKNLKRFVEEFAGSSDVAEEFKARVASVADGDTLSVMEQGDIQNLRTVRLFSVDAPVGS